MRRNIMIAGSYPMIITSGGNPRVNRDLIDNMFLRKYVSLFGELLKVKGDLGDLKIAYIGGYTKQENISRAKLYISAYNYYLNCLGYDSLAKSNLVVVGRDNIDEVLESIEQCDLLFLGIGADSEFASIFNILESKGINFGDLVRRKNMLVSSICSGSVMSAERIYGGSYDNYYYGKEPYEYPLNVRSLGINPVTMETDFCPNDATPQKNEIFIENYLKPDSKKCAFFACKPNSLFLIGGDKIYSYGEMYLFVDGECLPIGSEFDMIDVTELVALVNEYNKVKNESVIFDEGLLLAIKNKSESLVKSIIDSELKLEEKRVIENFGQKEKAKIERDKSCTGKWKQTLKSKLDYLFSIENLEIFAANLEFQERYRRLSKDVIKSYNVDMDRDYLVELYLKTNLVSLVKQSYIDYLGCFSDFKRDLYDLLCEYISFNDRLVCYLIETCGCLFSNRELKVVLGAIEIEPVKRPQQIIDSTGKQLRLFRKEIKYERS